MYGGAQVLDSRSDVVGGSLYNTENLYADQLLRPDPATAVRVPWQDATASRHLLGVPARRQPAGRLAAPGLRAGLRRRRGGTGSWCAPARSTRTTS